MEGNKCRACTHFRWRTKSSNFGKCRHRKQNRGADERACERFSSRLKKFNRFLAKRMVKEAAEEAVKKMLGRLDKGE